MSRTGMGRPGLSNLDVLGCSWLPFSVTPEFCVVLLLYQFLLYDGGVYGKYQELGMSSGSFILTALPASLFLELQGSWSPDIPHIPWTYCYRAQHPRLFISIYRETIPALPSIRKAKNNLILATGNTAMALIEQTARIQTKPRKQQASSKDCL